MSSPASPGSPGLARPALVILVGGVMFTFISYWRTAAVVLCDLASSAFYIGGIVEQAIGKAAPFFILAVLLFSYGVRAVYIESSSMFVRGGVYRVVREALGRFWAKIAVSALMFDYLLTGPISGVSAGQYLVGLGLQTLQVVNPELLQALGLHSAAGQAAAKTWGSVLIACLITVYFWRSNLYGIHHSSDRAVKIMIATTVMAVIMLSWAGVTLAVKGLPPGNSLVWQPDLSAKVEPGPDGQPVPRIDPLTGQQVDPLGFIAHWLPGLAEQLRQPAGWFSLLGVLGLAIAFGHSILAMSGEETLAQVYREVESPKLPNFKKAAFIIFVYSLLLTGVTAFLAVLLIPDDVRMRDYSDNLISGLAFHVLGPAWLRLCLSGFVVIVGAVILAGAVNTAIIGSNGVLNRVAEDGVLPDWFLKPHSKYGTTYRLLTLICGLQLGVIILSGGNMLLLGEAYAFGVIWSFVFQGVSMVLLRFKDPRPREFKVPLNVPVGGREMPLGLLLILLVLVMTAGVNLLTKEVATVSGLAFTAIFFIVFTISERLHQRRSARHEHVEQFHQETAEAVSPALLQLSKPYRRLVAIRTLRNLPVLERALADTDPETTDLIVVAAKEFPLLSVHRTETHLTRYDLEFLTHVVQIAERAGKPVKPIVLPTNNAHDGILRTAATLQVHELMMGLSNKFTPDEQMGLIAYAWVTQHQNRVVPLTVRVVGKEFDLHRDLGGGYRLPRPEERRAHSVAELRAAGVGVDRVLLWHDGTTNGSALFQTVLTMLDPKVVLALASARPDEVAVKEDVEEARQVRRELQLHPVAGDTGGALARLAQEKQYDLVIVPGAEPGGEGAPVDAETLRRQAACRVFVAWPRPH